jgi:exonuclease SbcD
VEGSGTTRKILFTSDLHLGLRTDDVDRTEEISSVMMFIVKRAVEIKADAVVFGGDVFEHNIPSDYLIALFIAALNVLRDAQIRTFVMKGNHEAISNNGRLSCLSFIEKLKAGGYPVELVEDIKTFKMWKDTSNNGDVYFTFLPFITRAQIKGTKFNTVQEYVDRKSAALAKKLPAYAQHFVFSHLNLKECVRGTEEGMLKKVDVVLPAVFAKAPHTVINAHIHTKQIIGNVNVVGSPCFVTFGEKERKKFYLQINIPTVPFSNPPLLVWKKTPCRPMQEFALVQLDRKATVDALVKRFAPLVREDAIVKFSVTVPEEAIGFDWEAFRRGISKHCFFCKPIQPRVLKQRVKRNQRQTIKLNPQDAVKLWLENHKPKDAGRIARVANTFIEGNL